MANKTINNKQLTGSQAFSLLTMHFIAPNVNCQVSCTLIKTVCPHFAAKPLPKTAKSQLPVGVLPSKTFFLNKSCFYHVRFLQIALLTTRDQAS